MERSITVGYTLSVPWFHSKELRTIIPLYLLISWFTQTDYEVFRQLRHTAGFFSFIEEVKGNHSLWRIMEKFSHVTTILDALGEWRMKYKSKTNESRSGGLFHVPCAFWIHSPNVKNKTFLDDKSSKMHRLAQVLFS